MSNDFCLFFAGLRKDFCPTIENILDNIKLEYNIGGLVSYFDDERMRNRMMDFKEQLGDDRFKIMLDSGAFTITTLARKIQENRIGKIKANSRANIVNRMMNDKDYIEQFLQDYMDYIEKSRIKWDVYAELDIPYVTGFEKVREWRNKWEDRGMNPLYVYHGDDKDLEDFKNRKTKFVGIGGNIVDDETPYNRGYVFSKKKQTVRYVRKEIGDDVWVHWFAMFSNKITTELLKLGFVTSVDSTSWLLSRFGQVYIYEKGYLKPIFVGRKSSEKDRERFYNYIKKNKDIIEAVGINYENLKNCKNLEIDCLGILSFVRFYNDIIKDYKKIKQISMSDWLE